MSPLFSVGVIDIKYARVAQTVRFYCDTEDTSENPVHQQFKIFDGNLILHIVDVGEINFPEHTSKV